MPNREYDEMSTSEVIADLNGEGYRDPDSGDVWDGEEFISPAEAARRTEVMRELQRAAEEATRVYTGHCHTCTCKPKHFGGVKAPVRDYHDHELLGIEDAEATEPSPLACPNCDETGLLAADHSWFRCHHCGYDEDRS